MSDVEIFFYRVQARNGGNLQWSDLNWQQQELFIRAINTIMILTSGDKSNG